MYTCLPFKTFYLKFRYYKTVSFSQTEKNSHSTELWIYVTYIITFQQRWKGHKFFKNSIQTRTCSVMESSTFGKNTNMGLSFKSENRCHHCSLFRVSFSVLSFKNYYFSPLKGSTHWYLCWTISIYFKQSISFLLSKEIQLALFSATLYAMWPLQCNSLGEFHLILQTGETLPDSRLLLQMIYVYS